MVGANTGVCAPMFDHRRFLPDFDRVYLVPIGFSSIDGPELKVYSMIYWVYEFMLQNILK